MKNKFLFLLVLFSICIHGCDSVDTDCCTSVISVSPGTYDKEKITFFVSQAFSPLAPSPNQIFAILGAGWTPISLEISLGNDVIKYARNTSSWGGHDSDSEYASDGQYSFKLLAKTAQNEMLEVTGKICLLDLEDDEHASLVCQCVMPGQVSSAGIEEVSDDCK